MDAINLLWGCQNIEEMEVIGGGFEVEEWGEKEEEEGKEEGEKW